MEFEWDEEKNRANRIKHGVWFEEAETVFEDEQARVFRDEEHSDSEDRFLILGMSHARLLIVSHCYRRDDEVVRIISAREPSNKERAVYEEGI